MTPQQVSSIERCRRMLSYAEAAQRIATPKREDPAYRQLVYEFALSFAMEQIGEASARITTETKTALKQVAWDSLKAERIRIAHQYALVPIADCEALADQEIMQAHNYLTRKLNSKEFAERKTLNGHSVSPEEAAHLESVKEWSATTLRMRNHLWEDLKSQQQGEFLALAKTLALVGKEATDADETLLAKMPTIPWQDIKGIRVLLTHNLPRANHQTLQNIAQNHIPELITTLKAEINRP